MARSSENTLPIDVLVRNVVSPITKHETKYYDHGEDYDQERIRRKQVPHLKDKDANKY